MNEGGIGIRDEESFAAPSDHWPHFFPNQQGEKYDYDGSEATHTSLRTISYLRNPHAEAV